MPGTACALIEQADGSVTVEHRKFGGFKRDRRALAEWAEWVDGFTADMVVMESTGIYGKSPYAALEKVGIAAWGGNARHVKNVPGRKTDICNAQWLATLARAGLVRASFIPPADIRHLRLIARQRQKLGGMLASEKNRLHKGLVDAGIRLNGRVCDLHGQSARARVKALLADAPIHAILDRPVACALPVTPRPKPSTASEHEDSRHAGWKPVARRCCARGVGH